MPGDFRSDTVTVPDPDMFAAITAAEVGDDVLGDDPSVQRLEKRIAEMAGKEAALFVCSGTMANQLAMRCQLNALESIIVDRRSHIFLHEAGGVSYHSQAMMIPIDVKDSSKCMTVEDVTPHLLDVDDHHAVTKGIAVENTLSGMPFNLTELKRLRAFTKERGLFLHMDGARLWNAMTAEGCTLADYAAECDTVQVCLSKGLGAPIGSMLIGPASPVTKARHFRKLWGGGWRQAGILAAAGDYAISHNLPRLSAVHSATAALAEQLCTLPGIRITLPVVTNMIWLDSSQAALSFGDMETPLREQYQCRIWADGNSLRVVLHHQISENDCARLVDGMRVLLSAAAENKDK